MLGLGFGVWGLCLGFGVWGLGFGVWVRLLLELGEKDVLVGALEFVK